MSALFSTRFKFLVHLGQIFIIVIVLILSIVRMFNQPSGAPRSRANTMSLGMSAKSLVIIGYQLLTEHVSALKRWASLRAYAILNAMEIVFWAAVVFLVIQTNIKFCVGISCMLSWVIVVQAIIMVIMSLYMAIVTYLDFRHSKDRKNHSLLETDSSYGFQEQGVNGRANQG